MKKVILLCMAFLAMTTYTMAQSQKDAIKERKETAKLSRAELNEKASKAARKEAKKYVKEGWEVSPGALPVDKQLDKSYNMQYEYDETGFPKFLMGEAMSIGENYDAAKMQALELAKQNLAGQIQTEVTELIESQVSNKQLSAEQAASITQSVSASKNLISQSIGRVMPVVELYRVKANKNKEVLVRVAYNHAMAMEAAKMAVRKSLQEKGDTLQNEVDKFFNQKN